MVQGDIESECGKGIYGIVSSAAASLVCSLLHKIPYGYLGNAFHTNSVLARFNVWRKVVCGGREGIQYETSTKKRRKRKGRERERERNEEIFIT